MGYVRFPVHTLLGQGETLLVGTGQHKETKEPVTFFLLFEDYQEVLAYCAANGLPENTKSLFVPDALAEELEVAMQSGCNLVLLNPLSQPTIHRSKQFRESLLSVHGNN